MPSSAPSAHALNGQRDKMSDKLLLFYPISYFSPFLLLHTILFATFEPNKNKTYMT